MEEDVWWICKVTFSYQEYVNVKIMHEIRIAEDLRKIIMNVAHKNNLRKISGVNVQFGEMIQIVPDIFRFAFEEVSRDTIFEGAGLNMEILPLKLKCENCSHEFTIHSKGKYACTKCKSVDIEIIQGKEIFIKSIEGE